MKAIEVRALVPEPEHREIKAIAALAGMKLEHYVLELIRRDIAAVNLRGK